MKTFKKTILIVSFLLLACILVKAERPKRVDAKVNDLLIEYIESATKGQSHNFDESLSDDFKQYINCNKRVLNYNKSQFMRHLKLTKNYVINCVTDYSIMEEKEGFIIAKVDMRFPTFTKTNYVTMSNGGKGWRITNISIHYN